MFYNLVLRSEKSEAVMLCPSFDCMVASKSQTFDLSIFVVIVQPNLNIFLEHYWANLIIVEGFLITFKSDKRHTFISGPADAKSKQRKCRRLIGNICLVMSPGDVYDFAKVDQNFKVLSFWSDLSHSPWTLWGFGCPADWPFNVCPGKLFFNSTAAMGAATL